MDYAKGFVYDIALAHVERGEPTALIPIEGGVWITALQPVVITHNDHRAMVAIAACMRAHREAKKAGEAPLT